MGALVDGLAKPDQAPRYQIVCPLASGGMAELFLARSTGIGGFERLVVVKRLTAQRARDPGAVQAFFDEARIAARLRHTNIVQVHDVEIEAGQAQIVMELLHGHDVAQLLERTRGTAVPIDVAVAITMGVCAGLHHAHELVGAGGEPESIVHRDVSPHNVFVTYEGGVKLIDFGIARARTRLGMTEQGIVKGKSGYMSPEQVQARTLDRRADVYSTAVVLYELTSGRRPFPTENLYDYVTAVVEKDPPAPTRPDGAPYPPALLRIVMKGLAREREQRYGSALEMLADLDGFVRAAQLDVSQFALARTMASLFGGEMQAYREAQKAGRSLAAHVEAVRHAPALPPVEKPAAAPRLRRRLGLAAGLVGVLVAGATLVAWRTASSSAVVEVAPRPPATAPPPTPAVLLPAAPPPAPASAVETPVADATPPDAAVPRPPPPRRRAPRTTHSPDPDALLPR